MKAVVGVEAAAQDTAASSWATTISLAAHLPPPRLTQAPFGVQLLDKASAVVQGMHESPIPQLILGSFLPTVLTICLLGLS